MDKHTTDVKEHSICQISDIKLSCWGCCGRDYTSKEEVEKDIEDNTIDFKKIKIIAKFNLLQFRERFSSNRWAVKKSGICSNLIKFKNGIYACPLHKSINELIPKEIYKYPSKEDLRWGHCDVNFKCKSVDIFEQLNNKQKQDYINWIKQQDIDHYTYSISNINASLIRKYLEAKNIKLP